MCNTWSCSCLSALNCSCICMVWLIASIWDEIHLSFFRCYTTGWIRQNGLSRDKSEWPMNKFMKLISVFDDRHFSQLKSMLMRNIFREIFFCSIFRFLIFISGNFLILNQQFLFEQSNGIFRTVYCFFYLLSSSFIRNNFWWWIDRTNLIKWIFCCIVSKKKLCRMWWIRNGIIQDW